MPIEFNSPVKHRFYGTKTNCSHCDAEGNADRLLKKCAGCALAVYCSKECQKAAWPEHKIWCRSSKTMERAKFCEVMEYLSAPTPRPLPPHPSRTGDFASPMSVAADWHQFFEHHRLTLMDFVETAERLAHTPDNVALLRRGELLLQCHFSSIRRPGGQPSPGDSWFLSHWEVTPAAALRQEHEDFEREWQRMQPLWKKLDADLKKDRGERYIGCLVMVNRCGVAIEMVLRPVYAVRVPEMLALPTTRDALEDVLQFFVGCVNAGVVLKRDPNDEDAVKPGKLHLMRRKKSGKTAWEWRPSTDSWDTVYKDVLQTRNYTPKTNIRCIFLMHFKDSLTM